MTRADASGTGRLFMHGGSQAVRLPKAFRLPGEKVRITREGARVILEPLDPAPFDVDVWRAQLRALGSEEFLHEGPPPQPPMPDPPDFD